MAIYFGRTFHGRVLSALATAFWWRRVCWIHSYSKLEPIPNISLIIVIYPVANARWYFSISPTYKIIHACTQSHIYLIAQYINRHHPIHPYQVVHVWIQFNDDIHPSFITSRDMSFIWLVNCTFRSYIPRGMLGSVAIRCTLCVYTKADKFPLSFPDITPRSFIIHTSRVWAIF